MRPPRQPAAGDAGDVGRGAWSKKHDAGDVNDLEEVFRSQELSRATGSGSGGRTSREGRDDALLRRMFGHASSARRDFHRDDEAGAGGSPPRRAHRRRARRGLAVGAADRGGVLGRRCGSSETADAAVSAEPPWRRGSGRYWTIAALSALAALVVAGVTAGYRSAGAVEPISPGRTRDGAPARRGRLARRRLHGADGAGLAHRSRRVRRPGPGSAIGTEHAVRAMARAGVSLSAGRPRRRERCRRPPVVHRARAAGPPGATGSSGTNPGAVGGRRRKHRRDRRVLGHGSRKPTRECRSRGGAGDQHGQQRSERCPRIPSTKRWTRRPCDNGELPFGCTLIADDMSATCAQRRAPIADHAITTHNVITTARNTAQLVHDECSKT